MLPDTDQHDASQQLPDTCPTSEKDGLSQLSGKSCGPPPWGRLNPVRSRFETYEIDLVKDEYTFGRAPSSDVRFGDDLGPKVLGFLSKAHFKLKKIFVSHSNQTDYAVQITDMSFNGTFINGEIVGKGNSSVLENNDVISLARSDFEVFRYESVGINIDPIIRTFSKELRDRYAVSRILGTGACGVVRLVFEKKSAKPFAMKVIQKKRFHMEALVDWESARLQREADVLRALSNPFIIRFEDVIDSRENMFLVTEYVEGGELFDRVKKGISENQAKFYFYQLALAVKYLHGKKIIHRDIKLENVLLLSNEPETLIKLSDFGYSKFMDPESVMHTICGTPLYIAPEVLKSKGKSGTYDKRIDIWSMGVVLYISLSGTVPFTSDRRGKSLTDQVMEGAYSFPKYAWQRITPNAKDLVKRMMTVDPDRRISIDEILKHPWLQDRGMKIKVDNLQRLPFSEKHCRDEEREACSSSKRRKLDISL